MGENKRKKERRVGKVVGKNKETKIKIHNKKEIGREGVKRAIIVKKKIANRKDKTKSQWKKEQENGVGKTKIYIRGRKQKSKRKEKEIVDKTESRKNISKRNKEKHGTGKEGVRKFIYAKVKRSVNGGKQECKC